MLVGVSTWIATRPQLISPASGLSATVPTVKAAVGVFERRLRVHGSIAASRYAAIRTFRMRGPRDSGSSSLTLMTLAPAGTLVKAGDVVAEFEQRWLEDHIDDQRSRVTQTRADVEKRRAEIMILRETDRQLTRSAEAEYDKAKLDLSIAEVRSEIEAQLLELSVRETRAAHEQLEKQIELQEVVHEADLAAMQYDVASDHMHLERHLRDWERMKVTTPVGGLVVMETTFRGGQFDQVKTGDQVRPGTLFMRVVDLSKMIVSGVLNQVDSQLVRLGQPVEIRLDAYDDLVFNGRVVGIGAMASSGGGRYSRGSRQQYVKVVPITVAIDAKDERLIPDLSASAHILLERDEGRLLIPRSAIRPAGGGHVVYVRDGDGFARREVEIEKMNATQAVVAAGLVEGDEVAAQPLPEDSHAD